MQLNQRSVWPWVAVAAIVSIAAVAVAIVVSTKNSSASAAPASLATISTAKPKIVDQTTTVIQQTKTVTQPAPAPARPAPANGPNLAACDQNISVNGNTSCPFADNVFNQYAISVQQSGAGSYSVDAYSPAAGQTYTDNCQLNSETQVVDCSHGNDLVQFPEWAASVYQTH